MTAELDRWLRATGVHVVYPRAPQLSGKFLTFSPNGERFRTASYLITARRGGFVMGWVEWSPQWGAWSVRFHEEARVGLSILAECHTFIRQLGGRQI